MAYTLSTLQTAFYRKGMDFMNDGGSGVTATTQYLNQAMQEIDAMYPWPYLLSSTTGTAPITVSDLRTVVSVQDNTNAYVPLEVSDYQNLITRFGDLTLADVPQYFYLSSQTTISTFPTNSDTLTVRYVKFAADMSGASDAPAMPDRHRPIIVDLAVVTAMREANVYDGAQVYQAEYQRKLNNMMTELLDPQVWGSHQIRQTIIKNY